MCVCVCEERERECVCVCVCVSERATKKESVLFAYPGAHTMFGWFVTLVKHGVISGEVLVGAEIPGGVGKGKLHCGYQIDFCIRMGSGVSWFNI